jgi:hypothetical protein
MIRGDAAWKWNGAQWHLLTRPPAIHRRWRSFVAGRKI